MKQSTLKTNVAAVAIIAAFAASVAPAMAQDATSSTPQSSTTSLTPAPAPAPAGSSTSPEFKITPTSPVAGLQVPTTPQTKPTTIDPDSVPVDPAVTAAADAEAKAKADQAAAARAEAAKAAKAAKPSVAKNAQLRDVSKVTPSTAAPDTPAVADSSGATSNDGMPQTRDMAAPVQQPPLQSAAQPPVETADGGSSGTNSLWWIGGGIAAAAIALALIAFAAGRRRKLADDPVVTADRQANVAERKPVAERREDVAVTPEPVLEHKAFSPAYVEPKADARAAPAPVTYAARDGSGRHEAAAMKGPTKDNPFLTRKARLKRARFYDRQERLAAESGRPNPFGKTEPSQSETTIKRAPTRVISRTEENSWSGGFKPAFGKS